MKRGLLRVIDANFNRAKEGLRVCEDILRFSSKKERGYLSLCLQLKRLRHRLTDIMAGSGELGLKRLVLSRDVGKDFMKSRDIRRKNRILLEDLFLTNVQRAKESLRVLEECARLFDPEAAEQIREARFDLYTAEKRYYDTVREGKKR